MIVIRYTTDGNRKCLGRTTYRECIVRNEPTVWAALIQVCPGVFYAQGCAIYITASQHAPHAADRERNLPYSI